MAEIKELGAKLNIAKQRYEEEAPNSIEQELALAAWKDVSHRHVTLIKKATALIREEMKDS